MIRTAIVLAAVLVSPAVAAEGVSDGTLRRSGAAPLEDIPGVTSRYGSITVEDGLKLRTILARPRGASGRLPAIYFVQWLSCDSIEYPHNPDDHGWQTMLQLLASTAGVILARTDKAGAGDSEGDCADLDYDTELAHHRAALARLRADPDVDPERIVLFGASMGGNMAALLAAETKPAGLVIWGTAIKSWFEHLVEFNRRHLELSGRNPAEIAAVVSRQVAFLTEFLIRRKSPAEIAATDPALGAVWNDIRGSSGTRLYGRPYRYHQQAQAHDWVGAVAAFGGPTLVLYGEYDWYEALDDHQLIARLIERSRPGAARLVVIPNMDHHFSIYPSLQTAYRREGGLVAPQRPVLEVVQWVRSLLGAAAPGGRCDTSPAAVASAPRALIAANNRGDVEAVLAGYTEDATWMPPDRAPVQGRSAFRERYESLFRENTMQLTAEVAEAHADGASGFARGRIHGTRTPRGGGAPQPVDDLFMALVRCESGAWRVSHLMWSHGAAPAR